jgi:hypothetical protein
MFPFFICDPLAWSDAPFLSFISEISFEWWLLLHLLSEREVKGCNLASFHRKRLPSICICTWVMLGCSNKLFLEVNESSKAWSNLFCRVWFMAIFFCSWVGSFENFVGYYLFTLDWRNIFISQQRWECSTKTLRIQKFKLLLQICFPSIGFHSISIS